MEHRIDTAPTRKLVQRTIIGPYQKFQQEWPAFMAWAAQEGLFSPDGFAGTIYMNSPGETPEEELHSELCMAVNDDYEAPEPYHTGQFPQGKFAVVTYVGPYEGLGEAWPAAWQIVMENYTCRSAPCFDIYRDNPNEVPLEKLRTEIWIPVE